jgi:hypothetical protein
MGNFKAGTMARAGNFVRLAYHTHFLKAALSGVSKRELSTANRHMSIESTIYYFVTLGLIIMYNCLIVGHLLKEKGRLIY